MTNEELKNFSKKKAQEKYCSGNNNTPQYKIAQIHAYSDGFLDGVKWRINCVWHDVNEKPNFSNIPILLQHKNGQFYFIDAVPASWLYFQKYYTRWAYTKDLIPNTDK